MASIVSSSSSSSSRRLPTLADQQENQRRLAELHKLENLKSTDPEISKLQNRGYLLFFLAIISLILMFVMLKIGQRDGGGMDITYGSIGGVFGVLFMLLATISQKKNNKANAMAKKKLYG